MSDPLQLLIDGPDHAERTLILAHGAGAAMDSEFMCRIAQAVAGPQTQVVRFEFPYMAARRAGGRNKPPDREPVLLQTWRDVFRQLQDRRPVIGGKSLGGRMASLVADQLQATGLICLGYPFHPSGKPLQLRTAHLADLQTPTLILQGERDALGNREEVSQYALSKRIHIHWLTDGDHSFKPRKASGKTLDENLQEASQAISQFLTRLA